MSSAQELFTEMLKAQRLSRTAARQTVFDALLQSQQPLAMRDLVERCGGIDRASVYRTVALFERTGIAQRLHTGWKYRLELGDRFAAHHHHLTCTWCGKSIAISERELEQFIDTVAARHGFAASAHQIEIQGRCNECRQR